MYGPTCEVTWAPAGGDRCFCCGRAGASLRPLTTTRRGPNLRPASPVAAGATGRLRIGAGAPVADGPPAAVLDDALAATRGAVR
jgi:hypothetical protein